MPRPRFPQLPRIDRITQLTLLLVASFALIVPIIHGARRAAHGQQATARQALGEYAGFAAEKFARKTEALLYVSLAARFADARAADGAHTAAATAAGLARTSDSLVGCRCAFVTGARAYFELSLDGDPAVVHPHGALDATAARALAAMVRTSVASDTAPDHPFRIVHTGSADSSLQVLVYTTLRDRRGTPARAIGFTTSVSEFMGPVVSAVLAKVSLLPASIAGGRGGDSLVSLAVIGGTGDTLHASPISFPGGFQGQAALDAPMFGTAAVTATLDARLESALYFGGSPAAHIRLFVISLAIAGALAALAVTLLRREHELARRRADFTSSVSHELRTPLAQILLCGETLRGGRARTAEEQRWATNVIVREARRLITMVENVLHVARAERQMVTISPEWLELGPTVEEVLRDFAPLAEARRVRWRVALEPEVVALVDRFALRQILLNLLDNAVRYGPEAQEVLVELRMDGGCARLTVADEGPGIPPGDRARIWQPFHRGHLAASDSAGAGLGLAVVHELVVQHGGTVSVDDAPSGARIVVTFPRAFSALQQDAGEQPALSPASLVARAT